MIPHVYLYLPMANGQIMRKNVLFPSQNLLILNTNNSPNVPKNKTGFWSLVRSDLKDPIISITAAILTRAFSFLSALAFSVAVKNCPLGTNFLLSIILTATRSTFPFLGLVSRLMNVAVDLTVSSCRKEITPILHSLKPQIHYPLAF